MNDAQALLVDTVDRILQDYCSPEQVQAAEGSWLPDLWAHLEEAGLTRIGIPEDLGGAGGDLAAACTVVGVAGQYAAPVPLAESMLVASWMRALAGLEAEPGPLTVGGASWRDVAILRRVATGWVLDARLVDVPYARVCGHVVVLATTETTGQSMIATVPMHLVRIVEGCNLANEPRDEIVAECVELPENAIAVSDLTAEQVLDRLALTRVVLISGAMEKVAALTMDYAQQRHQFGRPIASFQAIRFHLATIASEVGATRMGTLAAIAASGTANEGSTVAMARVRAAQAATRTSAVSHQTHGALGYTREYSLQLYTRRLWSWRDEYGSEGYWTDRVGQLAFQAEAPGVWKLLTGR